MGKVIVRIRGGLGNQLFCYAAARRLSLVNNAELVIDDVTGFLRDYKYRRKYSLNPFHINVRKATPWERLEPFERYRRGLAKWISRKKPFHSRRYIEENDTAFDSRLLHLKINGTIYLDGLWQDDRYFKDIEPVIRKDLTFVEPTDPANIELAKVIRNSQSPVSIHIRWYSEPKENSKLVPQFQFYCKAIEYIQARVQSPHFFIFSDYIDHLAPLTKRLDNFTIVNINNTNEDIAYADMWLMSLCKHHIIANSTFSWWGAWLRHGKEKIVCVDHTYIVNRESIAKENWIKLP